MFELERLASFNDAREATVVACYEDLAGLDLERGTAMRATDFACYRYHETDRVKRARG